MAVTEHYVISPGVSDKKFVPCHNVISVNSLSLMTSQSTCIGLHVPPLRTLHLSHISSLMLAWCKEGTVSQVLSYSSVV